MDEIDWDTARVALEWQLEMGVSEAIGDVPIERFDHSDKSVQKNSKIGKSSSVIVAKKTDPIALAEKAAAAAKNLTQLQSAINNFQLCDLRFGARNLVFSDGNPDANVMILTEAPGREEDLQAKPFVGAEGVLFDKMFAAIGLNRTKNIYIGTVVPWRPPQDREPQKLEIDMMTPFVRRHVALVDPDVLVCMGNTSCVSVLGTGSVNKIHGQWQEGFSLPVMPMIHPRALIRQTAEKKQAWQDLLKLKSWLSSRRTEES